ncbi:MAG: hypothetical protein HYT11_03155 [Candidatus Levybacteria bacterium]|nr:hypothetical protein [Candidatus Levybacteria bacterium]
MGKESVSEQEVLPKPIGYQSYFDQIDFSRSHEILAYQGTLGGVMRDLRKELDKTDPASQDPYTRILHPARIIRAVLDDKVVDPTPKSTDFIQQAVKAGMEVYAGLDKAALNSLVILEDDIQTNGKSSLFDTPLIQVDDVSTWRAMNPAYSRVSAELLARRTEGVSILFIPLAHGAVAVGMDIFLRYISLNGRNDSVFYPVRDSRHKLHDMGPRLTSEGIAYLRREAQGKEIVIFDEDVNTGVTLKDAHYFFGKNSVIGREPITLTNNNYRQNLPEIDVIIDDSFLSDL